MRNYTLGLLFSLLFAVTAYAQPSCGGNNPGGPTTANYSDNVVGSSFTATPDCLGELNEVELKRAPGGGGQGAEFRLYDGLIGSGGVLIFSQNITLYSGDNMIELNASPGNPIPCLVQDHVYTFVVDRFGPSNVTLQGYNTNNYPGGAVYTNSGGYNTSGDLFFSFTGTDDAEIDVQGQAISIPDGDATPQVADDTDYGVISIGNTATHTFSILNTGTANLLLTGTPYVTLSGDPEFAVTTQPASGTLMPNEVVTFSITYTPAVNGVVSTATVSILNTDCNEETYTFLIQGEAFECIEPDIPTLSTTDNNVCPNTLLTLSVASGNLNDATDWVWYDDVCGGNQAGTGTSIMVSPTSTTTYFVRGEGGCVTPGSCGEITITVEDLEAPVLTCPDPVTLEVDASCEAPVPDLTLLQGTVLANSVTEFSGAQGQDGWYYGYYPPADPMAFTALDPMNFSMNTWFGTQTGGTPTIDPSGGQPGIDDGVWSVRRWISDYTGLISVSGTYFDRDLNCGDGANVGIFHNGTPIFFAFSIPGTPANYSFDIWVEAGDQIDLVIDPLFDTACDDTELTAEMTINSGLMVTDNCGLSMVTITQDPVAGTLVNAGITTVTLTATDGMGNSDVCTVDLTFEDTILPEALCQNATVQLDAAGMGTLTPAEVDNGSNDACGVQTLALDQENFDCNDILGPNVVTLTVTDVNGNSNTCTATITVEDNVPRKPYARTQQSNWTRPAWVASRLPK
ncbi:MAG: choice-of-anchor D domain-containing protein [Saprospirales bacterium]|nr:choice-of-anchor D domain-containing protein [Saprospirales bacterium]